MVFFAGQGLRAAHLAALRMGNIQLPSNDPQVTGGVQEVWGDPVVFSDPGVEVQISGTGSGYGTTSDASGYAILRIQISTDGGTTWSDGGANRQDIGSSASDQRGAVPCQHQVTALPTGDVHVRMTHQANSSNGSFWSGSIVAHMMPTGG